MEVDVQFMLTVFLNHCIVPLIATCSSECAGSCNSLFIHYITQYLKLWSFTPRSLSINTPPVLPSPSGTIRWPSSRLSGRVAPRRSRGICQGYSCSPRSSANGYHIQGCSPVTPGNEGSNPWPEENLTICQPQLQQSFQLGELGRWVVVCSKYDSTIEYFYHSIIAFIYSLHRLSNIFAYLRSTF